MEKTLQLEIPLLLPEVEDEKDDCIERLLERLENHRGIKKAHVEHRNGEALFCLHFDPDHLSIEKVRRIAEQEGTAISDRYRHRTVHITGMDCGDCAGSIEHILGRMEGILNVSVNYATEKMWVEFDSKTITYKQIVEKIRQLGYRVAEEEKEKSWLQEHWELALAILSGIFLATGYFGELWFGLARPAAIVLYVLAYLTGGYDATRHGLKAALHLRFDIDFLMVVAAIGAALLGEWPEGALLLFLFSLGHALEHAATDKARNAIRALGKITPKTARVKRDSKELEIPVEKLERGDIVIIK
ncbi:MAG: cation-translocating P-type ATPase, partial [Calditrichaeota bacterium]